MTSEERAYAVYAKWQQDGIWANGMMVADIAQAIREAVEAEREVWVVEVQRLRAALEDISRQPD